MDDKYLVSVAMTTYNGEAFLREQLDSIISQSYTNWELIVCDDCSSDGTWQILQDYVCRDIRIRVYRNEKNLGFKKNFEKAISLCKGKYIALSDQDDVWNESHIQVLLSEIQGKSAASGNATIIDENGNVAPYLLSDGDRYFCSGNDVEKLYTVLSFRNPFFGAISIYSKDFFDIALPIPECVKYHDLWFSAIACCLNGLNYTFEPLLKHRIHGKNESGEHHVTFWDQFISLFSNKNQRKVWERQRIDICEALLLRLPKLSDELKEIICSIKKYHEDRFSGKRFSAIHFTVAHYKEIYSVDNYSQLLSRCIKILIKG